MTGITPLADDAPGRPIEASQSLLHYRNPHPHPQTDRLGAVWRPCRRPLEGRAGGDSPDDTKTRQSDPRGTDEGCEGCEEKEARVMMARVAMARSGSALDVAEAPAGA